tara:strand:- start:7556 stop:7861 length:306 start_codon:yes stop_codon:yes gene_type:complete
MDITTVITYFFITVTATFSESMVPYHTYNKTIYFMTQSQCETFLSRYRSPVEESFNDFWDGPGKDLMEDWNLETWTIDCEEWYQAWDGEFYIVGYEPKVTI